MQTQRRGLTMIVILGLVFVSVAAMLPAADPAAMVVGLTGKVEVQRAGRNIPVAIGTALEAGDRVVIPAGGKAVLMYRTSKLETVTASLTIESRQSEQTGSVYRQTLQTVAQVATTDAAKQQNRQGMIRPVPGEPAPIAPRNDIMVLDMRPTFTWFGVAGARGYTVQIRRTDLQGARPVRFQANADTVWSYPATEPALVPGATYEWTVAAGTVTSPGRPAAPQTFRVIGKSQFDALADMFDGLAASGVDPMSDGLFVTAVWYRAAGLYYEAERALARLAVSGNASGRTYHLLRGEVLNQMGDLEAASLSFQAADREPGL